MSEPKYRLQISHARLNKRLGLEAVVSVYQGNTLVEENQVNLSHAEKRKGFALLLSERFGIDGAEDKLLELMQTARESLESDPDGSLAPGRTGSQSTQLVQLVQEQQAELWHTPDLEAFATVQTQGHRENWSLTSTGFRRWLARKFYETNQKTPGSQGVQDALSVLTGQALFDGPEYPVFTRLAEYQGNVYLDLGNDSWDVVEITPGGWRLTSDPPVKFRRAAGMLPLPVPVPGGDIARLRQFINVEDRDWPLVLAWLVAALRPTGPYPVLIIHGDQGSAKSTAARVLRNMVDPNKASLRATPKDPHDLMIAASNGWVVALDNLSHLPSWLSDALCRLATGGGFSTRQLYTDGEEKLFDAQRPIIINGIEELATRGDLLDRAVVVYLPSIPKQRRQEEKVFWRKFQQQQPALLGATLNAISHALGHLGQLELTELPRMADFARWATAAETGLGLEPGSFINAYAGNQESANELTLDASPIVAPLRTLVERGAWRGSATELLTALDQEVDEPTRRLKSWPKTGQALSNALRRLVTNLRESGILVEFKESDRIGRRVQRTIRLRLMDEAAATSEDPHSYDVADVAAKIPWFSNPTDMGDDIDEEIF